MKMFNALIQYIRDWFPSNESPLTSRIARKRRGPEIPTSRTPKYRKVLSSLTNNFDDDWCTFPMRSSIGQTQPVEITDDEEPKKFEVSKISRNENQNGDDDVIYLKTIKGSAQKRQEAKKANVEYITRFTPNRDSVTQITRNGSTSKRYSPSRNKSGRYSLESVPSPTLNYSIRLDDRKKYESLLDHVVNLNSSDYSFMHKTGSSYGTPCGSLDRSSRLVELARSGGRRHEVIDLTDEKKTKLSTKDRVKRVLDNFETEPETIEDSDSDLEILPTPPSPKPDFKVTPVNSLKTVVDTSKATQSKWLDDVTKKHEQYLSEKSKEIKAFEENSSTLNEINRNLLMKCLTKKVQDSLAITDSIVPYVEEQEEIELPPLTPEHLHQVKKAFSGDPNEVLTKKFNLNVNRRDIQTLAGLNWLNDNVINFYMNLIIERGDGNKWSKAYAMNTFFYHKLVTSGPESLKRWTRRIDLFSYEFVCVPIHLGMHWCMAIINLKERAIRYYDSMLKPNDRCLQLLRNYLEFEHQDKKNEPYSTEGYLLENVKDIPLQMNGSDCGVFACTFAEFATRRSKFNFSQEDMPYMRKKMVVEILKGELLIQ